MRQQVSGVHYRPVEPNAVAKCFARKFAYTQRGNMRAIVIVNIACFDVVAVFTACGYMLDARRGSHVIYLEGVCFDVEIIHGVSWPGGIFTSVMRI